jgi:hypothetical protein
LIQAREKREREREIKKRHFQRRDNGESFQEVTETGYVYLSSGSCSGQGFQRKGGNSEVFLVLN